MELAVYAQTFLKELSNEPEDSRIDFAVNVARNISTTVLPPGSEAMKQFTLFLESNMREKSLSAPLCILASSICDHQWGNLELEDLTTIIRICVEYADIQHQPTPVRMPLLTLISHLPIKTPPQALDLLALARAAGRGARDPKVLLILFKTIAGLVNQLDSCLSGVKESSLATELQSVFDDLSLYYPLEYEPKPGTPNPVPREALVDAYNDVMLSSPRIVPYSVPFIVDQLTLAKEQDKIACFNDIVTVIDTHGIWPLSQISRDVFWEIVHDMAHSPEPTREAAMRCLRVLLDHDSLTRTSLVDYCTREFRFDSGSHASVAAVLELSAAAAESASAREMLPALLADLFRRLHYVWDLSRTKAGQDHFIWLAGAARVVSGAKDRVSGIATEVYQASIDAPLPISPRSCDQMHPVSALLAATLERITDVAPHVQNDISAIAVDLLRSWFDIAGGVDHMDDNMIDIAAKAVGISHKHPLRLVAANLETQLNSAKVESIDSLISDPIYGPVFELLRHIHRHKSVKTKGRPKPHDGATDMVIQLAHCRSDDAALKLLKKLVASIPACPIAVEATVFILESFRTSPSSSVLSDLVSKLTTTSLIHDSALGLASALRPHIGVSSDLNKIYSSANTTTLKELAENPSPEEATVQVAARLLIALGHPAASLPLTLEQLLLRLVVVSDPHTAEKVTAELAPTLRGLSSTVVKALSARFIAACDGATPVNEAEVHCVVALVNCASAFIPNDTVRQLGQTMVQVVASGTLESSMMVAGQLNAMFSHYKDTKAVVEVAGLLLGLEGQVYGKPERQAAVLVALAGLLSTMPDPAIPIVCKLRDGEAVNTMLSGIGHHGELEVSPGVAGQCAHALTRVARLAPAVVARSVAVIVTESLETSKNLPLDDASLDSLFEMMMDLLYHMATSAKSATDPVSLRLAVIFQLRPLLDHPRAEMRRAARRARCRWFLE
ncbi:Dos2-interacting transcription regulator of RNA-Pol-II [Carpediemonas membranifera]|uniref:MMS19 nucleotide excision repair protein n=1 Tax=Carpediemonas membranifera TaxID=201153 RepID=A0A8J6B0Q3_9EUKA|nr:Dos2-interacting transcription regulator of RNA-Pol-II [Carpediemonas membranifera]|eukprot:KAG9396815.1 Dos2-interacting transcription regulator of RNA-Pol-II [Carpediemonas membranifera]